MAGASPLIVLVTKDADLHADHIVEELKRRSVPFARFHPRDFPARAGLTLSFSSKGWSGSLRTGKDVVDWAAVRSVWHRPTDGPKLHPALSPDEQKFADAEVREAVRGLWSLPACFWVNDPAKAQAASNKLLQLKVAAELGLRVPRTIITTDPAAVPKFYEECGGNIVYKTLAQTIWETGIVGNVFTSKVSADVLAKRGELVARCPCQFQEYIEKRLELRITVIGKRVFAAALYSQEIDVAKTDWRLGTEKIRHEAFKLPAEVRRSLLKLMRRLGIVYGAIDMIVTPQGEFVFLEVNPHGQFGWIQHRTGMPLYSAMVDLLLAGKA